MKSEIRVLTWEGAPQRFFEQGLSMSGSARLLRMSPDMRVESLSLLGQRQPLHSSGQQGMGHLGRSLGSVC